MDVRLIVGKNVRKYRQASELTQAELARRMQVDRTYSVGLEKGSRNITIETLALAGRRRCMWTVLNPAILVATAALAQSFDAERTAAFTRSVVESCRELSQARSTETGVILETVNQAVCLGLMTTYMRTLNIRDTETNEPTLKVCAPASVGAVQLAKVFVMFVDGDPARMQQDWFHVAYDAFQKAFPCSG
jgi:transcriptional regulator with XRE-family HTH domain